MGLSRTVTNSPISRRFSEFRGDAPRQTLFPGKLMQHPKQRQRMRLSKPVGIVRSRFEKAHSFNSSDGNRHGWDATRVFKFCWSSGASLSATGGRGQ